MTKISGIMGLSLMVMLGAGAAQAGPPAGAGMGNMGGMGAGMGGMHGGMGAGMGSGMGSGMGAGMGNMHGGMGMGQSGLSAGASTRVLDNVHMQTALSGALAHSSISLPAGGVKAACSGFGSLGQCVAALHVAQNLQIPGGFDALKARLTGPNAEKLGPAIQALAPGADTRAAVKAARHQAAQDLMQADGSADAST